MSVIAQAKVVSTGFNTAAMAVGVSSFTMPAIAQPVGNVLPVVAANVTPLPVRVDQLDVTVVKFLRNVSNLACVKSEGEPVFVIVRIMDPAEPAADAPSLVCSVKVRVVVAFQVAARLAAL